MNPWTLYFYQWFGPRHRGLLAADSVEHLTVNKKNFFASLCRECRLSILRNASLFSWTGCVPRIRSSWMDQLRTSHPIKCATLNLNCVLSRHVRASTVARHVRCVATHVHCVATHTQCVATHVQCVATHIQCVATHVQCVATHVQCVWLNGSTVWSIGDNLKLNPSNH